jgi:predicted phosphoribosyltransferase
MLLEKRHTEFTPEKAGRTLAEKLWEYRNSNAVVVAVPRGGVPLGFEIAQMLHLPLELMLCKRMKHPGSYNQSIGSISLEDIIVTDDEQTIPQHYLCHLITRMKNELKCELEFYYDKHLPIPFKDKMIILVDDFLRSGHTLLACLETLRKKGPEKIIVALAFALRDGLMQIAHYADELLVLNEVDDPLVLEDILRSFPVATEDEVKELFDKAQYVVSHAAFSQN